MSVVVPPTSTTMASSRPERKAAPRIELVGPEAKLYTGKRSATSARITVPSFWVRYSGASMPLAARARDERPGGLAARFWRQAFSSATFSRSSRPIRPRSWE